MSDDSGIPERKPWTEYTPLEEREKEAENAFEKKQRERLKRINRYGLGFSRSFLAKTGQCRGEATCDRRGAVRSGGTRGWAIDRIFRGAVIRCGLGRRGSGKVGVREGSEKGGARPDECNEVERDHVAVAAGLVLPVQASSLWNNPDTKKKMAAIHPI